MSCSLARLTMGYLLSLDDGIARGDTISDGMPSDSRTYNFNVPGASTFRPVLMKQVLVLDMLF